MVHVIATIAVKQGKRSEFLEALHRNIPNVRAEAGCVAYTPATDIDSGIGAQETLRDDTVVILEQWESLNHLHAHLQAPHMAAYREEVKDLVDGVTLQVLAPTTA
jgi:quinol monooxygenase YgiN